MKAAAFAMSGPHVSAIISSVRACVPISIPLLTKIKSGILLGLSRGRRIVKFFLMRDQIESNSFEQKVVVLTLDTAWVLQTGERPSRPRSLLLAFQDQWQ